MCAKCTCILNRTIKLTKFVFQWWLKQNNWQAKTRMTTSNGETNYVWNNSANQLPPFCFRVILSPRLRAIPWVLLLILMYPLSFPSACFSMLKFTNASSPNTLFAYRLAARNPHSPSNADLKHKPARKKERTRKNGLITTQMIYMELL